MSEAVAEWDCTVCNVFPTFLSVLLSFTGREGAGGSHEVATESTEGVIQEWYNIHNQTKIFYDSEVVKTALLYYTRACQNYENRNSGSNRRSGKDYDKSFRRKRARFR